jgi:hypothetical protein
LDGWFAAVNLHSALACPGQELQLATGSFMDAHLLNMAQPGLQTTPQAPQPKPWDTIKAMPAGRR